MRPHGASFQYRLPIPKHDGVILEDLIFQRRKIGDANAARFLGVILPPHLGELHIADGE